MGKEANFLLANVYHTPMAHSGHGRQFKKKHPMAQASACAIWLDSHKDAKAQGAANCQRIQRTMRNKRKIRNKESVIKIQASEKL